MVRVIFRDFRVFMARIPGAVAFVAHASGESNGFRVRAVSGLLLPTLLAVACLAHASGVMLSIPVGTLGYSELESSYALDTKASVLKWSRHLLLIIYIL